VFAGKHFHKRHIVVADAVLDESVVEGFSHG
jgi:hypothetical protein